MQGEVKWFDPKKGFGFIVTEDDDREIFVHFSGLEMEGFRKLKHGQRVEFEIFEGDRGPQAKDVFILNETE
jgi:cold shock protein